MATKTDIANLAMLMLGQSTFSDVDKDTDPNAEKVRNIWTIITDAILKKWKWRCAIVREAELDVEETSITAFADYSSTVSGAVQVTAAGHNLVTGDLANIDDTTSYDADERVTRIDDDNVYIIATWVADDATGTIRWTSEHYEYRYPIPTENTCLRILSVSVSGSELTDWVREGDYILTSDEDEEIDVKYIKRISTYTEYTPHLCEAIAARIAEVLALNITQSLKIRDDARKNYQEAILAAKQENEMEEYKEESSSSWLDAR